MKIKIFCRNGSNMQEQQGWFAYNPYFWGTIN